MVEKCSLCKKRILKDDQLSSYKTCGVCNLKWKKRNIAGFCGNCGINKLPKGSNSVCNSCGSAFGESRGFE